MKQEKVLKILREHEEEIRNLGISSLYLFGSTIHGDDRPDSDVDLLFVSDDSFSHSLLAHKRPEDFIGEFLGTQVDLIERVCLHPGIYDKVVNEAVRVF